MLSLLRFSGVPPFLRESSIVNAILRTPLFEPDADFMPIGPSPQVEGGVPWPGQWDLGEVDVVFTRQAFRSIRSVAGCEDFDLKDRLRHDEYLLSHVSGPGLRGQVTEQALMCDPKTSIFFYVRFYKGWHEDGSPLIGVLAIWPALGRLDTTLRRGAARMAMSERQYDKWLQGGEPTMQDLPRLRRWFEDWNASPDHPIRIQELLGAKDRVEVQLTSADGHSLMVGYLPMALRKMHRQRLVEQEAFWNWLDERMIDMRQRGLMRENDMGLEDVRSISMRNTRGLPRQDGSKTDPVLCFEAWRRP